MFNPTRRAKRFRRPLCQPPETGDTLFDEDILPASSICVQHRRGTPSDALRGAMLVAVIVVTIVLYVMLWELERTSFVSVPNPNTVTNQSMVLTSSDNSEANSTRYPYATVQEGLGFPLDEDNRMALASNKPGRTPWLPSTTTHLPEAHVGDGPLEEPNESRTLSSFDTAYCNGPCRFLLPIWIGEQESKARVHFAQLLMLARRLGRTIVLPNVGNSRMSACSMWQFSAYYDTKGLADESDAPGSPLAINLEAFASWIDKRPVVPSSFAVSIHQGRHDADQLPSQIGPEDMPFTVESAVADPKMLTCLDAKLTRLRSSLPEKTLSIAFHPSSRKPESDSSARLVHVLSSINMDVESDFDRMTGPSHGHTSQRPNASTSLADMDILVLDYDLRYPLFASDFELHYTPMLRDLADRLADHLGPFFAIHWRMETVPVQNLAWCAASLVSTLHTLLRDGTIGPRVRSVWLATDHPRPVDAFGRTVAERPMVPPRDYSPAVKSSTFKARTSEHDDAIGILVEAFQPGGDLDAWTLTDLAEQLHQYPYVEGRLDVNETLLRDSGVLGVLDKLMSAQATVFISGSSECSKTSAFSKQIIEARQDTFRAGRRGIQNVVAYFGTW